MYGFGVGVRVDVEGDERRETRDERRGSLGQPCIRPLPTTHMQPPGIPFHAIPLIPLLYCTVLYCTVMHCTALHCTHPEAHPVVLGGPARPVGPAADAPQQRQPRGPIGHGARTCPDDPLVQHPVAPPLPGREGGGVGGVGGPVGLPAGPQQRVLGLGVEAQVGAAPGEEVGRRRADGPPGGGWAAEEVRQRAAAVGNAAAMAAAAMAAAKAGPVLEQDAPGPPHPPGAVVAGRQEVDGDLRGTVGHHPLGVEGGVVHAERREVLLHQRGVRPRSGIEGAA